MAAPKSRTHNIQTPGVSPTLDESAVTIAGMGSDDSTIDIDGRPFPLNEIVQAAFETSALDLLTWNALEPEERDALVQKQVAELTELSGQVKRNQPLTAEPRVKPFDDEPVRARPVRRGYGELPHPHEINVDEITAPVETTQGWLVPSKPMMPPRN